MTLLLATMERVFDYHAALSRAEVNGPGGDATVRLS
jgi:hypothetical protein